MKSILNAFRGLRFYYRFARSCKKINKLIDHLNSRGYDEETKMRTFQEASKAWMDGLWEKSGIKVMIKGMENIPKDARCVVVANHQSFMDVMILSSQLPFPNKTIAKIEGTRFPIMGKIYAFGSVLVDRKNQGSRAKALVAMGDLLDQGITPVFYPEGTRNKTFHALLPFHRGAFEVAVKKNVPILPIVIKGSNKVLPPGCSFHKGTVEVEILPVIEGGSADQLKNSVFKKMQAKLINNGLVCILHSVRVDCQSALFLLRKNCEVDMGISNRYCSLREICYLY